MGTGTVVNSLLGLGFYVLVARGLGVAAFGYFSFLLGLGMLASELGDLGVSSALVRFGARAKFPAAFSLATAQRLTVSLAIILIFLVASMVFDHRLIYSAAVAVTLLLVNLITQSFIAQEKYPWFVAVNIGGNTARLALTAWLMFAALLTPTSALVVFCLGGAFSFLPGLAWLVVCYRRKLFDLSGAKAQLLDFFHFSKWLAASFGVVSLSSRLDIPIVFALAGPAAAGIYSSAQKLTSFLPQISANLEGVFAPKFANATAFKRDFRDFLVVSVLISLGLLAAIFLAPLLITLVFGASYQASIPIFQLLLVGLAVFFLFGPANSAVVYRFSRPNFHLIGSVIQLIVSLALYFALVPSLGAAGAALAAIASNIAALIFFWTLFLRLSQSYEP